MSTTTAYFPIRSPLLVPSSSSSAFAIRLWSVRELAAYETILTHRGTLLHPCFQGDHSIYVALRPRNESGTVRRYREHYFERLGTRMSCTYANRHLCLNPCFSEREANVSPLFPASRCIAYSWHLGGLTSFNHCDHGLLATICMLDPMLQTILCVRIRFEVNLVLLCLP